MRRIVNELDTELMRKFLITMSHGDLVVSLEALKAVDPNARLEFYRDGPLVVMRVKVLKDKWGRTIDRAGQVKCLKCDVWVNYDYPDGSKREYCSEHETR